MPFCTHCGTQVNAGAAFCAKCGARQPGAAAPPMGAGEDWMRSISDNSAMTLCYAPFVGWVAALIVLSSQRFREHRLARFHAFQGLYLFVLWLVVDMAAWILFGFAGPLVRRTLTGTLKLSIIGGWLLLLYKTSRGELVRLPFLGDLAERSVAEQSMPRP